MTWMGFSQKEPAAPEVNVITSTSQSVSFEVTIPGIYTQDTIVNGVMFTRLILPLITLINTKLLFYHFPHHNVVFGCYPHKIHSLR